MSFGSGWIKLHPNYLETIPKAEDLFAGIPPNTQMQQIKAVQSWMATNWTGVCEVLTKISNPTLVITGTDDIIVPTANSLIIAGKIPGAWLVQIKDAGHQLPEQYPDKLNRVLQLFYRSQQKILLDRKIVVIYYYRTYDIRLRSF